MMAGPLSLKNKKNCRDHRDTTKIKDKEQKIRVLCVPSLGFLWLIFYAYIFIS
jgi:hypothetical protein